jgi:hypothetical protein
MGGEIVCGEEMRHAYKFELKNLKERNWLEDLRVHVWTLLNYILKKLSVRM